MFTFDDAFENAINRCKKDYANFPAVLVVNGILVKGEIFPFGEAISKVEYYATITKNQKDSEDKINEEEMIDDLIKKEINMDYIFLKDPKFLIGSSFAPATKGLLRIRKSSISAFMEMN